MGVSLHILVTGGSGFVGYYLCKSLIEKNHEVSFTYFSHKCEIDGADGYQLDLTRSQINLPIKNIECIIHAAALANVDLCEKDPILAYQHNVKATENMIAFAQKTNSKFIYISTSFVFPGKKSFYTDKDEPCLSDAPNVYGKTKLQGEILVKNSGLNYLILRIDQPYYWHQPWQKENTVTRTLKKLIKGEVVKEILDWYNCPTFLPSFCDLVASLVNSEINGVYNAAGPDFISRFDWAKKIAKIFGYDETLIQPMHSSSLNLPAKRPNVNLDSTKIYSICGFKQANIDEGVNKMFKQAPFL